MLISSALYNDPDLIFTIRNPSEGQLFSALYSKPALIEEFEHIPPTVQEQLVKMDSQNIRYIKHPCESVIHYLKSLNNISEEQSKAFSL